MKRNSWADLMTRYPALFALILLVLAIIINLILQPNMFDRDTLNSNMRVFLPIILLAAGQAVVILGGGIDISVGGIVSIINCILATRVGLEGSPQAMWQFVGISLLMGVLAGAINGFFVAYLRLQPIITTYATRFILRRICALHPAKSGRRYSDFHRQLYRNTTPLGIAAGFLCDCGRAGGLVDTAVYPLRQISVCSGRQTPGSL